MGYGRLRPSDPGGSSRSDQPEEQPPPPPSRHRKKLIVLSLLSVILIIVSAATATLVIGLRTRASAQPGPRIPRKPTQAIARACSKTRYQSLCVESLLDFPGSTTASEQDLVHISFNMTLQHFSKALYDTSGVSYLQMDQRARSAFDDCLELLEDSVDALSRSLSSVVSFSVAGNGGSDNKNSYSRQDVMTWLSAALTSHDTCADGFADVNGEVKSQIVDKLKDLSELVSNCLAIFSSTDDGDFSGIPIQNKRRLLSEEEEEEDENSGENIGDVFPKWLSRKERKLLQMPVSAIQADIIVSKDGKGTCKTITEAIKKAPQKSNHRTIIYVKAGR